MQRDDRIAIVNRGKGLRVVARDRVSHLVPSVAVAAFGRELVEDGVVDGEVHGDHGVTAVDVLQGLGVVAGLVVCHPVPDEVVAAGLGEFGSVGVVDGEMEGDDRVAACRVGERERGLVGAFGVGDAVDPGEGVASFLDIS